MDQGREGAGPTGAPAHAHLPQTSTTAWASRAATGAPAPTGRTAASAASARRAVPSRVRAAKWRRAPSHPVLSSCSAAFDSASTSRYPSRRCSPASARPHGVPTTSKTPNLTQVFPSPLPLPSPSLSLTHTHACACWSGAGLYPWSQNIQEGHSLLWGHSHCTPQRASDIPSSCLQVHCFQGLVLALTRAWADAGLFWVRLR